LKKFRQGVNGNHQLSTIEDYIAQPLMNRGGNFVRKQNSILRRINVLAKGEGTKPNQTSEAPAKPTPAAIQTQTICRSATVVP